MDYRHEPVWIGSKPIPSLGMTIAMKRNLMQSFDNQKFGTIQQDVAYCEIDGQELKMDVYYPAAGGPWPCMVFVHGGGWSEGDKAPLAVVPTEAGILVVSIN